MRALRALAGFPLSPISRSLKKRALLYSPCLMMSTGSRFTNKLSNEKSPYLLQHQHNPIEWYPWGPEAFQKAKELNRPIFLSVGYSTCHWCHVMEKESFENEQIAQYLNEHFVSIKVDREERPDVDKLYMSFIQAMSGAGGWPMTVFLTPDLDPITGGTYFPPHDSPGSMGLPSVLRLVTENWSDKRTREAMGGQGKMITDALRKGSVYTHGDAPPLDPVLTGAFKYKVSNFDEKFGGFGNAPKFPKACDLEFLIYHFCWTKIDSERELCRHMLDVTLDAMSRGGIHDHIGKGFHRYSVDEEWHVPHFEKMLYDQAQLLGVYADACHVCGDKYKHVVEDIAQYMDDCLSHEEGGFYAAEDADSLPTPESTEKKEGAFCVWQRSQVEELLKDQKIGDHDAAEVFCEYFNIEKDGNVSRSKDPHGELQNQNVLRMKRSHDYYENRFGIPTDVLSEGINKAKATLARVRFTRPPPHLDSKMVTAWQGLAISGLSKAAIALQRPAHVEGAVKTVEFVKKHLMDESGHLLRAAYRGEDGSVQNTASPVYAFSDDYAFLIQGLLDLYQVKPDIEFLKLAERLQMDMDSKFWDTETESGYFIGSEQGDVKVRVMEDQDGAEPCANSVAVGNLIRLYDYFEDTECKRKAEKIVAASSSRLIKYPFILTKMISGYHRMVKGSTEIMVVGKATDEKVGAFLKEIQSYNIWNKLLLLLDPSVDNSYITERSPTYAEMLKSNEPTVFICSNFACGAPLTSLDELKSQLKELAS
ncbi:hypothetical protein Y032_0134g1850 [Ancylostoma ceylanicum]|uniref:Spermatogenesis-associated protein 20-like TRX domain-containing protein n=1 Tax=Ancylostoma ceylanicum TaxID=53326 RepID=A0A016T650_9BILA|nr:hypothetical protein Y032_0134g1850 [Ancylostoma ceylanicum]